jgi:hypothetical protein
MLYASTAQHRTQRSAEFRHYPHMPHNAQRNTNSKRPVLDEDAALPIINRLAAKQPHATFL